MDYNELTEKFKSRVTLFERLLEEALYALQAALEQAAIKYLWQGVNVAASQLFA